MTWVLQSPQIHSTFGNLGFLHAEGYQINENCNAALETILHKILTEDKYLRTYRRCINFGQNIKKDLLPLLLNTKDEKTVELLIKILVNLTIPVECLLSMDVISKTDVGRHTIFEINNLLTSTKIVFTDNRVTKVFIEFLKKNIDEPSTKLSVEQCTNISNSLLLLRNILHIPEETSCSGPSATTPTHSVQNQIIWNIFSQSVDKVLIKLMTIPDANNWGVTMVQVIALLYKDQHVVTLHKLLNLWLETSQSSSSEDNESNTSLPDRGSKFSSPALTSDPPSDSSDTGGSGKCNERSNSITSGWESSNVNSTSENGNHQFQEPPPIVQKAPDGTAVKRCLTDTNVKLRHENPDDVRSCSDERDSRIKSPNTSVKKMATSETSDYGYGTQIENQEYISTSSNEDELPTKKPVHQKPRNNKPRLNNKSRTAISLQERKRKKIVKRGKTTIINVQGLTHITPIDDDISNILKEFTVDFLLKGYNSLVQTLQNQILNNLDLEIDTSHFFWLVTYFLKFATQIELDLEHVSSVLSFDIVSYLTSEGVNLCEQFELDIKLNGNDLTPSIRRLHLVVTAIREIVQAIDLYKKFSHICNDDMQVLTKLQIQMCETEELRSLLVLLIRHYNPKYHTKQYLQDLIVTNHILLLFLDNVMKLPEYIGSTRMVEHIKQFATPEIMNQYGLLLEDYASNGEFVNDCIFTIMHHVGGELGCLVSLFQPKILKAFTSIWKTEFEICDDWTDLIEYVINTFIKKPHTLQGPTNFRLDNESFDGEKALHKSMFDLGVEMNPDDVVAKSKDNDSTTGSSHSSKDRWTEDELSSLSWNYMQCNTFPDAVGEIVKLFKEEGMNKSRKSVVRELFKLNLINKEEREALSKSDCDTNKNTVVSKEVREDDIGKLCDQLKQDGKSKALDWIQKVLLETCFAKIQLEKRSRDIERATESKKEVKLLNFELFKEKSNELPVISPVSYHSLNYNQSIPLVPWNCEQAAICRDLKILHLLHNIGFHMPVDTGKLFIRMPNFWTANFLYEVACKISPVDISTLKFSLNDVSDSSEPKLTQQNNFVLSSDLTKDTTLIATPDNIYQVHKQKHLATMVNFTPMPGSTFNSDVVDVSPPDNWLEVVKKSQDCKIILNLESRTAMKTIEGEQQDIVMQGPASDASAVSSPGAPQIVLPTVMTTKQNTSSGSTNVSDTDYCNNSMCDETASVASDLTRMYVSDEEDKPDPVVRAPAAAAAGHEHEHEHGHEREHASLHADPDCDDMTDKRPWVQFSSQF